MKFYTKDYGYVRANSFWMWLKAVILCRGDHRWLYLGDPCWCGSDNCYVCSDCGYQTHD